MSDSKEASSYAELEAEVARQFGGDWEKFLKAVSNPAEIMHFVLKVKCKTDAERFRAWFEKKNLPGDWLGRFFMTLTPEGEMKTKEQLEAEFGPNKGGEESEAAASDGATDDNDEPAPSQ